MTRTGIATLGTSLLVAAITVAAVTLWTALRAHLLTVRAERELAIAQASLAAKAAELEAVPFRTLFSRYNASPHDDPQGPFTAPGPWFEAPGLDPIGPKPGRIEFPVDGIGQLNETMPLVWAVMPRDLNGDSIIDAADRSSDYSFLPVRIVLEWRGALGIRRLEQVLFLRSK